MSYEVTEETLNVPHVIEDINGNIRAMTYNWGQAEFVARKYRGHLVVIVRPANEDDVASFMRRLGDC